MYMIEIIYVLKWVFSQCTLYLKIEMDLEKIIFNYLIISIGKFSNIPCTKVIQSITIYIQYMVNLAKLKLKLKGDWENYLMKSL